MCGDLMNVTVPEENLISPDWGTSSLFLFDITAVPHPLSLLILFYAFPFLSLFRSFLSAHLFYRLVLSRIGNRHLDTVTSVLGTMQDSITTIDTEQQATGPLDSNPLLESDSSDRSQSSLSENDDLPRYMAVLMVPNWPLKEDPTLTGSSSFSARLRQTGGVNSIDSFARSWQRAAYFPEVLPRKHSFTATGSDDEWATIQSEEAQSQGSQRFSQYGPTRPLIDSDVEEGDDNLARPGLGRGIPGARIGGTSMDRSFGTSYGTISSRVSDATRRHAIQFHREQQAQAATPGDNERDQLFIKQVQHEDGTRENLIVGQSTVPQTIFNSVNVLIGVGLLSLPLAMKQAGWLIGLLFLAFAAVTTSYTAKILAKCLDVDRSLITYADLAFISFGHRARLVISLLFCLELIGACVALIVLFADSLHVLLSELSILQWKVVCGFMLLPLNFVPLRLLSVTSILGILSCTSSMFDLLNWGFELTSIKS